MHRSFTVLILLSGILFLTACQSDSQPYQDSQLRLTYTRELTEFELLGIDRNAPASLQEIQHAALADPNPLTLHTGQRILLVQSGTDIPDPQLTTLLSEHFHITPFSGMGKPKRFTPAPGLSNILGLLFDSAAEDVSKHSPPNYAAKLRLAANQAGIDTIVVYWGALSSAITDSNHTTAWVPLPDMIEPANSQALRLQLKICLINVKSGQWDTFTPPPLTDDALNLPPKSKTTKAQKFAMLKTLAYSQSIIELIARYGHDAMQ